MLLRRHVHACGNERAIGRDRAATGRRSLGRDDRRIASWPAIRRQEHLIGIALHRAIRRVARRSNDPDADVGAGRAWIAFGAWRSGRAPLAFRPLISTAAQHRGSQCDGDQGPQDRHRAASRVTTAARTPQPKRRVRTAGGTCHLVAQRKFSCREGSDRVCLTPRSGKIETAFAWKNPDLALTHIDCACDRLSCLYRARDDEIDP
jgi:hypothetical protein